MLLDSEGIDAVTSDGSDDHCIFTLTILLASVLIYNSAGVPTRTDLDGLEYPLTANTSIALTCVRLLVSFVVKQHSFSRVLKKKITNTDRIRSDLCKKDLAGTRTKFLFSRGALPIDSHAN